jgi:hypothetical protein
VIVFVQATIRLIIAEGANMSHSIQINGDADLAADCKKWQARVAELLEERDRLASELAKVTSERDAYLKTVYHIMSKDLKPPTFTKEELLACVDQEPPFPEFIAELKREMGNGA